MNCRYLYAITSILAFLLVCSCSDKKKERERIGKINPVVQQLDETPDTALFVRLDKVANDSIYVTLRDDNKKKVYGISQASAEGMIKGSLTPGDELSIYPQNKTKSILISINVTELSGRWFYDLGQHRGFDFGKYGALSTLNNVEISFREWKLLNGRLYLYYVDMQQASSDRHEYEVEPAEIRSLSKENMTLYFRGRVTNCKRQHGVVRFHTRH